MAASSSRLLWIELENFMSIKHAFVEYDDRNILNLCGYNDSGKSAFTRANEIMFYNAYSSEQSGYITKDEDYFLIRHGYDDGVVIERIKRINGKSEFLMKKNDVVLFSNKLETSTFAVSGIPKIIEDYQGVVDDEFTNEKLNVRRNTDKLFLINTTGGENYKILNTVLRSDVLAKAVSNITMDRNKSLSALATLTNKYQALTEELKMLDLVDDLVLVELRDNTKILTFNKTRVEYIMSIGELEDSFNTLLVHDELGYVDSDKVKDLLELSCLHDEANRVSAKELTRVDVTRLVELCELAKLQESLGVTEQEECSVVLLDRYKEIKEVCAAYNTLWSCQSALASTEKDLSDVNTNLLELSKTYDYKICKNCGSLVV